MDLHWHVKLLFDPRDIWIGVFWDRKPKEAHRALQYWDIYICLIPMFPIRIFQGVKFQ